MNNKVKGPASARSAFTLIELLVVIAIIAILTAILFPVFAQAREKARQAVCISNMKQIGLAAAMYSQDFDEMATPAELQHATWAQILYPYMKNAQVQGCPSAKDSASVSPWLVPTPPGYPNPQHLDYVVNARAGYCVNGGVYVLSLAEVTSPALVVFLCDGGTQASAQPTNGKYITPNSPYKPSAYLLEDIAGMPGWPFSATYVLSENEEWAAPIMRHQGLTNTLFFDGHVKATRADQWYYPNTPWLDPARGGGN